MLQFSPLYNFVNQNQFEKLIYVKFKIFYAIFSIKYEVKDVTKQNKETKCPFSFVLKLATE